MNVNRGDTEKSKKLFHWTYIGKRSRHFYDYIIFFNVKQEFYWKQHSRFVFIKDCLPSFVFIKDCLPSFVKTEIGSSLSNEQTPDSFCIRFRTWFSLLVLYLEEELMLWHKIIYTCPHFWFLVKTNKIDRNTQ
jgi:hypothetical protein